MSYGKKMGNAVAAVVQMHRDTVALLYECDRTIGNGMKPVLGNQITRGLSQVAEGNAYYMADGMFRYYRTSKRPELVRGVTAVFYEERNPFHRPLFIVGKIKYHPEHGPEYNASRGGWDLWHSFFQGTDEPKLDIVLSAASTQSTVTRSGEERIESIKLVTKPLYSIQSIGDVEAMMNRIPDFK